MLPGRAPVGDEPLVIDYPDLPITARRAELLATLAEHQVVVVAGETGSGKSTQLPKFCLELGRGRQGMIAHTQPRRIAARSVAERVAEELGVAVGGTVGYAVRFSDHVGDDTRVKVMTDGILLNELKRDRLLSAYDTVIVDEAHERSLNIDFLLGYLHRLLPERPDLHVIVTSATIDTARFSAHFDDAPVVEVSGRSHPVEIRHRTDDELADLDVVEAVCDAVVELTRQGPGDVLVFASGEREIRDIGDAVDALDLPGTEVVPLFARLSAAEQHRVFAAHRGRRVVVATNIAETSITVPGVRYVVDPGTARISRYNKRTKVQRLPIERISRASADQRAGRCGRVAPGVCIRLYSEQDFEDRPAFTEPEILRTNLASVVLQMTALDLGDVESFPFVEPPDRRHIADAVVLLEDLGALEPGRSARDRVLTPIGRQLARLPLDPTLGRMVLAAAERGCAHEVMVIAAGLSIQDPRERPTGQEAQAAELHARFRVPGSDFLGLLALWDHVRDRQQHLSSSKFRRECRAEFLHFVRLREWQDVYTQLRAAARELRLDINRSGPADAEAIHRSLLAGLIGNVGCRDDPGPGRATPGDRGRRRRPPVEYAGVRNTRFSVGRGSVLAKSPPRWLVAAELVETDRLWAGVGAAVQPSWIEDAAGHLVTVVHDRPTWNPERGVAEVVERVRLRALTLVEGRTVALARVDPAAARELFVLHALVRGEWDTSHGFAARNRARIEEVRALEERTRRRDLLVDEEALFRFFDDRVPSQVDDVRRFDRWWRDAGRADPHLLDLRDEDLVTEVAGDLDHGAYPPRWTTPSGELALDYAFDPGAPVDGMTVVVPLARLERLDAAPFEWLVPGLREELVTTLVRRLPKSLRRDLAPIPERVAEVLPRLDPDRGPLRQVLAAELTQTSGVTVDPDLWDDVVVPDHLRVRFRIVDGDRTLAEGPDLAELERRLRPLRRRLLVEGLPGFERDGLQTWDVGDLPRDVQVEVGGEPVTGHPCLIDQGTTVGLRLLASRRQQKALHWNGVRRLLALAVDRPARLVQRRVDPRLLLALAAGPHGSLTAAADDALAAVLDAHLLAAGGAPFEAAEFEALWRGVRGVVADELTEAVTLLAEAVTRADALGHRLAAPVPGSWTAAVADLGAQLRRLVFDGCAVTHGVDRLGDLPRYLDAMGVRLDRLRESPERDRREMAVIERVERALADRVARHGPTAELAEVGWMVEELRVQLFAQQRGAAKGVSEARILERLHVRRHH